MQREDHEPARPGLRPRLWWLLPISVAVGLGLFVWSEIDAIEPTTPLAEAHGASGAPAAREPLDCDPGDTGTIGYFDYRVTERQPGRDRGDPRDAVAAQLLRPGGKLHGATIDEFVAGPTSASRSEQRLVRNGRLLAVATLKLEPGVGWVVTSLGACLGVLA